MDQPPLRKQSFNHASNNSSSSSSVVTVQRAASIGPGRSRSRPRAPISAQDDSSTTSGLPYPSKTVNPPESRRAHSRSNSISGVREGVGNLNRWSQSTTSSRGSHQGNSSFSRRMSIGGAGTFTFGNSASSVPAQSSPNKLTRRQGPPTSTFLPPINTTPSLQQSVDHGSSPLTGNVTPSTAGLLSAAIRSTVPDYFGGSREDSQLRDFSIKKSPSRSGVDPLPISANRQIDGEEGFEQRRGHSRNRSQAAKSSGGTGSSRERSSRQPSQKAMLSKALQKANTAVLLDNAQNFEGAMQAYSEACALLQQVMHRSSGDEDKRKLEAIRTTYTSRISELKKIAPHLHDDGKALPARPESGNFKVDDLQSPIRDDEEDTAIIETATATRIVNDEAFFSGIQQNRSLPTSVLPRRRESLLPSALNSGSYRPTNSPDQFIPRSYSKSPMRDRITENNINLAPPMESQYMPPPLSPGRREPMTYELPKPQQATELSSSNLSSASPARGHVRAPSNESMSWLDTIDESGGSTASSVHSRTSSLGVRRKHIRAPSGATEAEFDAALDAAVEAAYDDGFEPMDTLEHDIPYDEDDEVVANVRRKVELAKERVRQTEREAAIQDAHDRERKRLQQQQQQFQQDKIDDDYAGNESEEEERMLEEMTRGYVMEDFEFGLQSKSALPRESDSSGFSGRTWNSSIGSNPTTAGTTLSTVTETLTIPQIPILQSKTPPPSHPPPAQSLPSPPNPGQQGLHSVRSRRLSGQNPKQLKIETTVKSPVDQIGPLPPPSIPPPQVPIGVAGIQPKTAGLVATRQVLPVTNRLPMPQSARQASSPFPGPTSSDIISPPTPTLTQTITNDSDNGALPRSGSPNRTQSRSGMQKNFSSSSLKNIKGRNLSVSNIDDGPELSPITPMSSQFISTPRDPLGRIPTMPTLPTPIAAAFKEKMNGAPNGGLYLFNQDMHSPDSPGSPNPLNSGAPIPLEPCPNEFLLRPFWLMRALYQTLAHPRGGYLSTKLFVPRDVWRVKGVKIKGVEDKIANCDFLTAALMKLSQVDSFDADAVLEEMQLLEGVLEQVQATLSKKLGNEVGVQGSGGLFKDASNGGDGDTGTIGSKSGGSTSSKSSFSWRRLRSKNSGVALANSYTNKTLSADAPKEGLTMSTLPMTSATTKRFAKRDVSQVQFSGPHANYMGALAKLFDAAQVIDQIARQVDDPGLRHADKTQVGLELCTRHAAEFFGFYICRFVLTDIGMLLDKFIKRGSEWVLV